MRWVEPTARRGENQRLGAAWSLPRGRAKHREEGRNDETDGDTDRSECARCSPRVGDRQRIGVIDRVVRDELEPESDLAGHAAWRGLEHGVECVSRWLGGGRICTECQRSGSCLSLASGKIGNLRLLLAG